MILPPETITELKQLLEAGRPLPWRQGESTHQLVDATGYLVADFHHGPEQVLTAALANAAPALIEAAAHDLVFPRLACGHLHGDHDPFGCDNRAYMDERDALRAKNERMREALVEILAEGTPASLSEVLSHKNQRAARCIAIARAALAKAGEM